VTEALVALAPKIWINGHVALQAWIADAARGEAAVYLTEFAGGHRNQPSLVKNIARRAVEAGQIVTTQRRRPDGRFDYIAVRL